MIKVKWAIITTLLNVFIGFVSGGGMPKFIQEFCEVYQVRLGNTISDQCVQVSGISQGSVLRVSL